MAARKTSIRPPPRDQTLIRMIAGLDQRGSISQSGPCSPKNCREVLISPYSGLSSHIHSTDRMTPEMIEGIKKMVRKSLTPRAALLTSIASSSEPRMTRGVRMQV